MSDWGFVLNRNCEASLEPLRLKVPLGVGFQRRTTVVRGGHRWLWVVEKKLRTLELVLEERRRKEWLFSKATRNIKVETLKCFCSREKKLFSHKRRHIVDHNGQIVDICPMNLKTKFRQDPTVNEFRRTRLPRHLQTASLKSFSQEASLRSFLLRFL